MSFPTTQWTLIAEATLAGSPQGREALAELFRRYERPVLNQIGRRVRDAEDARDLAQAFWLRMVEDRTWRQADAARGRFRQFLSTVLLHFLRDDYRRRTTARRGGASAHTPLDDAVVADPHETHAAAEFDRDWAECILDRALSELESTFAAAHKENLFQVMRSFLPGAVATPAYEDAARQANVSTDQIRVEIHRMRTRLRELIRLQIAETVASPEQIDEEFKYLRTVLGKRP